jgi:arginase family enzyme
MASDDFVPPGMREQFDSPSYQGIPTFGMRPWVTEPHQLDAIKPDIAVVGAPWDDSTTNRPGCSALGRGLFELMPMTRAPITWIWGLKSLTTCRWSIMAMPSPATGCGKNPPGYLSESPRGVTPRGITPVILGGDHSVTYPAVTAVCEHTALAKWP